MKRLTTLSLFVTISVFFCSRARAMDADISEFCDYYPNICKAYEYVDKVVNVISKINEIVSTVKDFAELLSKLFGPSTPEYTLRDAVAEIKSFINMKEIIHWKENFDNIANDYLWITKCAAGVVNCDYTSFETALRIQGFLTLAESMRNEFEGEAWKYQMVGNPTNQPLYTCQLGPAYNLLIPLEAAIKHIRGDSNEEIRALFESAELTNSMLLGGYADQQYHYAPFYSYSSSSFSEYLTLKRNGTIKEDCDIPGAMAMVFGANEAIRKLIVGPMYNVYKLYNSTKYDYTVTNSYMSGALYAITENKMSCVPHEKKLFELFYGVPYINYGPLPPSGYPSIMVVNSVVARICEYGTRGSNCIGEIREQEGTSAVFLGMKGDNPLKIPLDSRSFSIRKTRDLNIDVERNCPCPGMCWDPGKVYLSEYRRVFQTFDENIGTSYIYRYDCTPDVLTLVPSTEDDFVYDENDLWCGMENYYNQPFWDGVRYLVPVWFSGVIAMQ